MPIQLLIDHRERHIAAKMTALCPTTIRAATLTVGDYVFATAPDDVILLIIERKSLRDLADSIRDGRMENNDKLMAAQKISGCRIAYLIEAADPYQSPAAKHGGITFAALTAKLDSLMLRFGVSVVWTRDTAHTIARLSAMYITFAGAIKRHGVPAITAPPPPPRREGEPEPDEKIAYPCTADDIAEPGAAGADEKQIEGDTAAPAPVEEKKAAPAAPTVAEVVQYIPPTPSVAAMRLDMMRTLSGPATAAALLAQYDIAAILLGRVSDYDMGAARYSSGRRLGTQGYLVAQQARQLCYLAATNERAAGLICAIHGISAPRAKAIIAAIPPRRLIALDFAPGAVADIVVGQKRIGPAIEARIRAVFAPRAVNVGAIV